MQTKHLFLTAILFVFSMLVVAAPVDPMRALEVAEQFAPQSAKAKRIKSKTAPEQSYEIVYTHRMPNSDRAAFYVVKLGEKGFVIISADDVANPILGYNYTNLWPTSISAEGDTLLPPQVLSYLNSMALQIETAIEKYPNLDSSDEWNNVGQKAVRKTSARKSADALPDSVGPLLTTTWGQGQYYNALCPEDAAGEDGHVPTGCVATAMAQIIHYWGQKEEIKTRGIHSYDCQYGNLTVNYDSTSYDFGNMPDALTAESTPEQINAVAKLMYECGVAVNMQYSAWASGANTYDARAALINFYHFSPNLSIAEKNHFSNSEWAYLVRKNIVNQQPVYYASQGAAHAFICDGFNQEGYYHFNFGWSGDADGWYVIEALDASGIGALDIKQSAILDIRLDKESNVIIAQSMGQSVFCVDKPLKFCNLLGYNAYVGEENTEFYAQSKVIFKSKHSIRKLLVDIISFDYQEVILNDGADPSIEIDHLSSGSTNPNVSLSNSLECNYIGPGILYSGFELLISQDDDCRMVSNVTTDISSKSIKVSWSENGQASSWKVEYGKEGFSVGDGVSLITDTTFIVLPIENLDTIYEVRIQPICDTLYNNYVRSTVINRYWTDCVTSEPNGYYLDAEGDIHIYTAKGLAWLAKMAENDTDWSKYINYIEKDVFIENDIDLYGHLWSPIRYWLGNWDGNGCVISNMHAKRKSGGYATGFFNEFSGDTIANIGFINSYVDGRANESGTIAARIESCAVINSYSINCVIDGPSIYGGGLAGAASNSSFVNCFVIGNVHAGYGMGGLVGESRVCTLFNCYTSIKSSKYFNNLDFGTYRGLISASTDNSNVSNCFVDIDYIEDTWSAYSIENIVSENAADKVYFFGGLQEHLQDYKLKNIVGFTRNGNSFAHTVPDVALDYQYQGSIDLLTALNQYVEEMNSALLSKWVWDSVMKLPILTKEYIEIACPSVTNVTASNISYNETYALKLTWHENGNADEWEIKCMPYGVTSEDSAKYYTSYDTTYIISDLILGKQYDISVTPICDTNEQKFWSTPFSHLFDKIYWVDVITTRPEGYVVGEDGNIQISSPEGLAWLSVCSNGLNGQAINYYNGITIEIVNNIDMGKYKWTPISHFLDFDSSDDAFAGYINGNNYTISNIYCHEIGNSHNLGLIGRASYAIFKNIKIKNAKIIGFYGIGTLISKANNCYINNCHAKDVFVHGTFHVGGLVGNMTSFDYGVTNNMDNIIVNSSSSGVVFGDQKIGGFIGMGTATIHNSFSTCDIYTINAMQLDFRGGFIGEYAGKVENCYNAGLMKAHNLNYEENPSSGGSFGALGTSDVRYVYKSTKQPLCSKFVLGATVNISDTATFDKQGNFSQSIIIDSDSKVNLLDALNAWVDANNSEGQYLHWVADTAGVNGGFPIFAEEDTRYIITFCNDDGTILQQDTLELGEMPEYRGEIPTKDSTEQYNYTFIGWGQEIVPVTKDVTYYAQYESTLNQYEVTFYNWNGEVLQSTMVDYGAMPEYFGVTPTKPEDDQYVYTFSGWEPEITIVVAYAEYTAQYDATDKVTTAIQNTQSDEVKTYKILRNNKIFIIRGDKVYSILGNVIED